MPKRKQSTAPGAAAARKRGLKREVAGQEDDDAEARTVREIKQYADAVRRKYLALRRGRQGVDERMERMLKPVSTPLHQIEKHTKPQTEIKREAPAVKHEPIIGRPPPPPQQSSSSPVSFSRFPPFKQHAFAARAPWGPQQQQQKPPSFFTSTPTTQSFSSSSFIPQPSAPPAPAYPDDSNEDEDGEEGEEEGDRWDSANQDVSGLPPMSQPFIERRLNPKDKTADRLFSPRPSAASDGSWMLGGEVIKFLDNGDIHVGQNVYTGTPALYHFLFMKTMPDDYTDEDVTAYTRMLILSGVHRKGYDTMQARAHTNTNKYKNVISPLLRRAVELSRSGIASPSTSTRTSRIEGQGYKLVTDQTKDYVYYSSPNDLVDRLRLLVAAEQAGNKLAHHHNEIESILQELRDIGIIST